ncbi:hypothetical protein M0R45_020564 [Rubus argutus]|uniref:Major facilitator superfamily (MFS) profile domain-containing protein n=1 Tax=Rubus argutus TaxID=59490 RepID=A0AAW1XAY4_RUBAR
MAKQGHLGGSESPAGDPSEAKITPIVIISCILAATGGLMFGYEIGISGGVTSMPGFLKNFYPDVYASTQKLKTHNSNYCKYNNQRLQLFTSLLYLAALVSTFFASHSTKRLGRKMTMLIAGIFFIVGTVLNAAFINLATVIIGRVFLGCGVGFANQVVPLSFRRLHQTRIRGGLNILFQLNVTLGILFANLVNYGAAKYVPFSLVELKGRGGWRLSLGLAGVPALLLTLGSLIVVDTPNSLIQRGKLEEGKSVLRKIRGTENVEAEYFEIVEASKEAREIKHPFRNLLKRKNRPPLIIAIAMQIFQQFTGINAIMFYAPVLFATMGFGNNASLYAAVITGAVNVLSTVASIFVVDKLGRRMLLLEAGVQMLLSQLVVAIVLALKVKDYSNSLSFGLAILVVVMVFFCLRLCMVLGTSRVVNPKRDISVGARSAGQSITVCVNMICCFLIGQIFLLMLCSLKYAIFLFFSAWVLVMTLFVLFLIPETKNVPIEEMTERVWKQHWFWKRYIDDHEGDDSKRKYPTN